MDTSVGAATDAFEKPFSAGEKDGSNFLDYALTLIFPEFEAVIQLEEYKDYSVGRVSEGQKVLPDIDLSPYDGFNNGVSRLHAEINVKPDLIEVKDLGSSNGSILNDHKLIPHVPYPVENGDVLIFGKLIARVVVKT